MSGQEQPGADRRVGGACPCGLLLALDATHRLCGPGPFGQELAEVPLAVDQPVGVDGQGLDRLLDSGQPLFVCFQLFRRPAAIPIGQGSSDRHARNREGRSHDGDEREEGYFLMTHD
jgi:hypothetical protein